MGQVLTTPAGMRRLLERLRSARERYDAVTASNPEAAESGDNCVWHDNFAYEENQRQMHSAARAVHDLRALVARAMVLEVGPSPTRVAVGTEVEVQIDGDDAPRLWVIGGYEDGAPEEGRISYSAPLAQGLLGAEVGEVRSLRMGARARVVEVVSIRRAEREWR